MALGPEEGVSENTGVVEGSFTETSIGHSVSAIGNGIGGVEVWCENPGTGQRLGQDISDEGGHYRLIGLPVNQEMRFCFRYSIATNSAKVANPQICPVKD
jgi:hypothetical protein